MTSIPVVTHTFDIPAARLLIHPLSFVDVDCEIGEGTSVWQFASVIRGALIGEDCVIGSCAIVDGARVGERCRISHGAQIHPGSLLGDEVFVGPGAVLCNDLWPVVSKEGFDAEALKERFTVIIEDGASIGANAVILPGVRIGKNAVVAAGARVTDSLPEDCVWRAENDYIGRKSNRWRTRRMQFAR